jgi:nitrogen-specific signal transduction histidine kinase
LSKRDFELGAVTLRTDFDRSLPNVEADRVQLQQVIPNLARNAIEAMAGIAVHGGRLWVEERKAPGTTFAFMLPLRLSARMSDSN